MVARGDLGVEMPLEKVPGLQKRITREARRHGRPVIVATQMLESMISAPAPTRAEVSDVATAVFEGADAIMLSAESASGAYPIQAVATMNRIAEEIEHDGVYRSIINAQRAAPERTGADAVAIAARNMSETLDLKALVAWTASGATALRVARERPSAPILALTPNRCTARRLTAVWGVESVVTKDADDVGDMANRACKFAVRQHFASPGDRILIIAGVPFGTPGATNMVRLAFIGAHADGFHAE
jgi:pyruvate kinase